MIRWNKAKLDLFFDPENEQLKKELEEINDQIMDKGEVLPMNPNRADCYLNEIEKSEQMLIFTLMESNIDIRGMNVYEVEVAVERYSKNAKSNKGEPTDVV